jgi:hypothetical protein
MDMQPSESNDSSKPIGPELVYVPNAKYKDVYGAQFFTSEVKYYVINSEDCGWCGHAEFQIVFRRAKTRWTELHRFSDFDKLLYYLRGKYEQSIPDLLIPPLPSKTILPITAFPEELENRRIELNGFVDQLLSALTKFKLLADFRVQMFFGIDPLIRHGDTV